MIAAAYLVLTICNGRCAMLYWPDRYNSHGTGAVTIPQPSMDQCIRQANAFNSNRKDTRAMCVRGSEK